MVNLLDKAKSLRIYSLTPDKFEDYYKFKSKFSTRFIEKFKCNVINNPLLLDKSNPNVLIAVDPTGEIVGELTCNPLEFYYKGKKLKGYFYQNLFVLESYRKRGIGTSLILRALESFWPAFCTVNKDSIRVFLSCGFKVIGSLNKYVWFKQFFSPFQVFFYPLFGNKEKYISNPSCLRSLKLPKDLILRGGSFKLVDSLDWKEEAINNDLITFVRTNEILQWRFFNNEGGYFFYLLDNCSTPTYFVVRKVLWRGLKFLEIVDYRTPLDVVDIFKLLLDASKFLAKVISFDGIITMSSLKFFDIELIKSIFFRVGEPLLFLANVDIDFQEKEVKDRNVLFATSQEK